MIQRVYEEIVVRDAEFVSARLTPEAYAHGLAFARPQARWGARDRRRSSCGSSGPVYPNPCWLTQAVEVSARL
jgi:hypothetical protein